jgi:hypothetical protein
MFLLSKTNHHAKECCFHIAGWAKGISKTQANFVVNDTCNCGANNTPSQVINHTSHNVVNEISQLFTLCLVNGQLPLDVWYLNYRAIEHMTPNWEWFIFYNECTNPTMVYFCDDNIQEAIDVGNMLIQLNYGSKSFFWHVLHVLGLSKKYILAR